jgi:hypothetical protein
MAKKPGRPKQYDPVPAKLSGSLTTQGNQIRKAYHAGKKFVEVEDIVYRMKLMTKQRAFHINGKPRKQKEDWIVCLPSDGMPVPVICVELKAMGNLRSKHEA